jgi:hypothetical protein
MKTEAITMLISNINMTLVPLAYAVGENPIINTERTPHTMIVEIFTASRAVLDAATQVSNIEEITKKLIR